DRRGRVCCRTANQFSPPFHFPAICWDQVCQRNSHGPGGCFHALHRHGRGHFHSFFHDRRSLPRDRGFVFGRRGHLHCHRCCLRHRGHHLLGGPQGFRSGHAVARHRVALPFAIRAVPIPFVSPDDRRHYPGLQRCLRSQPRLRIARAPSLLQRP